MVGLVGRLVERGINLAGIQKRRAAKAEAVTTAKVLVDSMTFTQLRVPTH